jgi:hypothetical protein
MMIIGCDFHPTWLQIAWLDTETGETGEQRLVHAGGDAERTRQSPVLQELGVLRARKRRANLRSCDCRCPRVSEIL